MTVNQDKLFVLPPKAKHYTTLNIQIFEDINLGKFRF